MTEEQASRILKFYSDKYAASLSNEQAASWKEELCPYGLSDLKWAMEEYEHGDEFYGFPRIIARVTRLIKKKKRQELLAGIPTPEEAVSEVAGRIDRRWLPNYSHPLIAQAVAAVGYEEICNGQSGAWRRPFIFAYKSLLDKWISGDPQELERKQNEISPRSKEFWIKVPDQIEAVE